MLASVLCEITLSVPLEKMTTRFPLFSGLHCRHTLNCIVNKIFFILEPCWSFQDKPNDKPAGDREYINKQKGKELSNLFLYSN